MNTPIPAPAQDPEREQELLRRLRRLERELDEVARDQAGTNLRLIAMFLMGISTGVCSTLIIVDILSK